MNPRLRNFFLAFGIVAIVVMLCTFDVDYAELVDKLKRAGAWFPAIVGIWAVVYFFNAWAFQIIVNNGAHDGRRLSFARAYKLTVSGFAFSYTTPFGFGGGPYRVLELNALVGTSRAASSVVLYSMMHILSHICLWASSVVLFICIHTVDAGLWVLFALFAAVCAVLVYFFYVGYRNGMVVKLFRLLTHIPLLKRWSVRIYEKDADTFAQINSQIADLHSRGRRFYSALFFEYVARVVNALEYYFILNAMSLDVSFFDSILVLAFSSLFSNMLFFLPMQLGAREGGLAIIVNRLAIPGVFGLYASFFTRIRELVWIVIGVSLVKVGNKNITKEVCSSKE